MQKTQAKVVISEQLNNKSQYYLMSGLYFLSFVSMRYFQFPQFTIWVIYGIVPLLDKFIKLDIENPNFEQAIQLQDNIWFKLPLYMAVFSDWLFLLWSIQYLPQYQFEFGTFVCFIVVASTMSASNINVAHELSHKDNLVDKTLGTLTLSRNLYMHFAIEHIFGHHRNVATPKDPATARHGQNVYQFWFQSIIGGFISAWKFESKRIKSTYQTNNIINVHNKMIQYITFQTGLLTFIYYYFGMLSLVYFVILAFAGVLYLETVNYLEHYGLNRKEISKGVYEPVDIRHSWNAPHKISNLLLFKLQRHSDHHENPHKPYQTLCSFEESPMLPHGYPICVLLSLFPKLWRKIIDEQLKNWKNKNYSIDKNVQKNIDLFTYATSLVVTGVMLQKLQLI